MPCPTWAGKASLAPTGVHPRIGNFLTSSLGVCILYARIIKEWNNSAPEEYPPDTPERRGHRLKALFVVKAGKVAGKVGKAKRKIFIEN